MTQICLMSFSYGVCKFQWTSSGCKREACPYLHFDTKQAKIFHEQQETMKKQKLRIAKLEKALKESKDEISRLQSVSNENMALNDQLTKEKSHVKKLEKSIERFERDAENSKLMKELMEREREDLIWEVKDSQRKLEKKEKLKEERDAIQKERDLLSAKLKTIHFEFDAKISAAVGSLNALRFDKK